MLTAFCFTSNYQEEKSDISFVVFAFFSMCAAASLPLLSVGSADLFWDSGTWGMYFPTPWPVALGFASTGFENQAPFSSYCRGSMIVLRKCGERQKGQKILAHLFLQLLGLLFLFSGLIQALLKVFKGINKDDDIFHDNGILEREKRTNN